MYQAKSAKSPSKPPLEIKSEVYAKYRNALENLDTLVATFRQKVKNVEPEEVMRSKLEEANRVVALEDSKNKAIIEEKVREIKELLPQSSQGTVYTGNDAAVEALLSKFNAEVVEAQSTFEERMTEAEDNFLLEFPTSSEPDYEDQIKECKDSYLEAVEEAWKTFKDEVRDGELSGAMSNFEYEINGAEEEFETETQSILDDLLLTDDWDDSAKDDYDASVDQAVEEFRWVVFSAQKYFCLKMDQILGTEKNPEKDKVQKENLQHTTKPQELQKKNSTLKNDAKPIADKPLQNICSSHKKSIDGKNKMFIILPNELAGDVTILINGASVASSTSFITGADGWKHLGAEIRPCTESSSRLFIALDGNGNGRGLEAQGVQDGMFPWNRKPTKVGPLPPFDKKMYNSSPITTTTEASLAKQCAVDFGPFFGPSMLHLGAPSTGSSMDSKLYGDLSSSIYGMPLYGAINETGYGMDFSASLTGPISIGGLSSKNLGIPAAGPVTGPISIGGLSSTSVGIPAAGPVMGPISIGGLSSKNLGIPAAGPVTGSISIGGLSSTSVGIPAAGPVMGPISIGGLSSTSAGIPAAGPVMGPISIGGLSSTSVGIPAAGPVMGPISIGGLSSTSAGIPAAGPVTGPLSIGGLSSTSGGIPRAGPATGPLSIGGLSSTSGGIPRAGPATGPISIGGLNSTSVGMPMSVHSMRPNVTGGLSSTSVVMPISGLPLRPNLTVGLSSTSDGMFPPEISTGPKSTLGSLFPRRALTSGLSLGVDSMGGLKRSADVTPVSPASLAALENVVQNMEKRIDQRLDSLEGKMSDILKEMKDMNDRVISALQNHQPQNTT